MIFQAVLRILLGFFKKFAVADNLGTIVNYVYTHLNTHPGAPVPLGFYGYPLQMYADFSGLTDIALGAGVLLGVAARRTSMRRFGGEPERLLEALAHDPDAVDDGLRVHAAAHGVEESSATSGWC